MEQRDERLWLIAKKRAGFKAGLIAYIIVNAFLWILWAMTDHHHHNHIMNIWPIWPTLGWGIGIAFQYFDAYHNKNSLIDKEYKKLLDEQNKQV
jgi:hypothetical protein